MDHPVCDEHEPRAGSNEGWNELLAGHRASRPRGVPGLEGQTSQDFAAISPVCRTIETISVSHLWTRS